MVVSVPEPPGRFREAQSKEQRNQRSVPHGFPVGGCVPAAVQVDTRLHPEGTLVPAGVHAPLATPEARPERGRPGRRAQDSVCA